MQFLNAAIQVTEIALAITVLLPIAHTIGFVLFGDSRRLSPAPIAPIDLGPELEPETLAANIERAISKPVPAIAAAAAQPVAVLAVKPESVSCKKPKVSVLRKRCTAAGIRWRNAGPGGRHLRQDEMIAALS
ncbi:MAG: hypothetical protein F6J97_18365 [Leptolyngbya sp. SIO4C1]|nr:hypothetical protein [Leptolyngbya sp. SIO4C1]